MASYFVDGARGSDSNSGTAEANAWKSLANSTRLAPGDTLTALPGTITGTFAPPSGTAAAPITLRAKSPGETIIDGSVRIDGLAWTRIAKGYQTPFSRLAFNVFQRDFETAGKLANFNNRDFNQYASNPQLDLHGTPAEFKWQSGNLRLNAIPSTPQSEPLYAAVVETAINLNGKSHVNVEGIVTRGHKHAVATNGGTGIHFSGCRFTFCGSTAVWLVGLADASMVNCVVQGGGSWGGHYEDLVHGERLVNLRLEGCAFSYGGHSGLIILDGRPGKITLKRCHFFAMGGSLLTLKRNVNGLLVEDCWLAEAAKSTAVDAHKVPHAGVQLSGKGHVFKNTVFRDNGKDILATSDGNADSNPICSDNQFDHCTFSGTEAGVVEMQEYAPSGLVARNVFRDCILLAPGESLSCWFAGQSKVTLGRSNIWDHCQVGGSIRGSQGSFASVTQARAAEPSVYPASIPGPLAGTGSSLTAPPTTGGDSGGGGTDPPPTGDRPVLRALVPISGAPGVRVTATGVNFGSGPEVLVPVPEGARRLSPPGGTDTEVSWNMPADVVTGEVRVRNGSLLSNPITFTRTGGTPPIPPTPAELVVTITALPGSPKGVAFSGVCSERPVTLTITAKTPDGRTAQATAVVAGDTQPPPVEPPSTDLEKALVVAVNAARAANGNLPPLAANSKLAAAARGHCEWMAANNVLSHTGSGGSQMGDRITAAGYKFVAAAENIASGFSTVEAVMAAWLNSSGHRANLLGPYKEIGVAAVKAADGRMFWVQDFGTASGATAMLRG